MGASKFDQRRHAHDHTLVPLYFFGRRHAETKGAPYPYLESCCPVACSLPCPVLVVASVVACVLE